MVDFTDQARRSPKPSSCRLFLVRACIRRKGDDGLTTIPKLIDYVTPSEVAICLHEAGHAAAALLVGVAPALVELTKDPSLLGPARNRIPIGSQAQRESIACGAFAVEYRQYREGRLVDDQGKPVDERQFVQIALGSNAHEDKVRFFGANLEQPDLRWPKPYDEVFMRRGISLARQLSMLLVTEIAEALRHGRRRPMARGALHSRGAHRRQRQHGALPRP